MTNATEADLAETQAALAKLRKRQERNQRAAFARGVMQGICSMLGPNDVVLDCGANVGAVTGLLAQTGAEVHAFEPDPYAFGKLQKAVADKNNVVLHNVAVGTSAGEVRLMRAANFDDNPRGASVKSTVLSGGRGISEDDAAVTVAQIDLLQTLTDLIDRHGEIAFLKMDIEGAELEILEAMHARDLFGAIRLTVSETHERKFKDLRPRFRDLRRKVAETYSITRVNLDWI